MPYLKGGKIDVSSVKSSFFKEYGSIPSIKSLRATWLITYVYAFCHTNKLMG